MDWTDPLMVQAFAVAVVAVFSPLIVWLIRLVREDFDLADKWKKLAVAIIVTFAGAAALAPGTWQQRVFAGSLAVLLSQGGYNIVRGARGG